MASLMPLQRWEKEPATYHRLYKDSIAHTQTHREQERLWGMYKPWSLFAT